MCTTRYSDKNAVELNSQGNPTSLQHCHSKTVNYKWNSLFQGNYLKEIIDKEIIKTLSCIGFFKTYQSEASLDISVRAQAAAAIAEDEQHLAELRRNRPWDCNIL
jgi:hypothetical protein